MDNPLEITDAEWMACKSEAFKDADGIGMMSNSRLYKLIETKAAESVEFQLKRAGYIQDISKSAVIALKNEVGELVKFLESAKDIKKEIIDVFRSTRTVSVTEVAATIKPLEDLRKFFLGADHDKEISRLREFVDLCERLEKLKASGFLDTVADTLLKLS